MKRAEILDEAKKIVTSDRNEQYGEPENSFTPIAELWSAYLSARCAECGHRVELGAEEVAVMMALFKIGRQSKAIDEKADTWIDAAGYIACGAELALGKDADVPTSSFDTNEFFDDAERRTYGKTYLEKTVEYTGRTKEELLDKDCPSNYWCGALGDNDGCIADCDKCWNTEYRSEKPTRLCGRLTITKQETKELKKDESWKN